MAPLGFDVRIASDRD